MLEFAKEKHEISMQRYKNVQSISNLKSESLGFE